MISKDFFQNLLLTAQQDLSQAHLDQHFATAKMFTAVANYQIPGRGAWSAVKPLDTLRYNNNTVSGKKYWVSGIPLCDWVVVPANTDQGHVVVVIDKQYLDLEPVDTMGMEATMTTNFVCDQAPATYLYSRNDNLNQLPNRFHMLAFITVQLGLSMSAFNNIDTCTKSTADFNYIKNKIKIDIEILKLLWQHELDCLDQPFEQSRINLIYSFGKKTMAGVANLVTELTGSTLFKTSVPAHQRYKDLLIYITHMRNIWTSSKEITWSF